MDSFYIKTFGIEQLWGHRSIELSFFDDVNIIIGPNASGKTTILNLLRFILTVDVLNLAEIDFKEAWVELRSFDGKQRRTIRVRSSESSYQFKISRQEFSISVEPILRASRRGRSMVARETRDAAEMIKSLVQTVWLPVSRRLPIEAEEEEELVYKLTMGEMARYRARSTSGLESVDLRLRQLLDELIRYRLRLDAQLSERYKEFEKRVLQMILFSEEHDRLAGLQFEPLTEEEKEQLVRAFQAAGLMDRQMRRRIDAHFREADQALARVRNPIENDRRSSEAREERTLQLSDVFIIPLIRRTKAVIEYAQELEEEREALFEPLYKYEAITSSFLNNKVVRVDEDGSLSIRAQTSEQKLTPNMLSSGEKQILILLTQALLWEDKPVVYVADEPELSLHVTWQEKLLESLRVLGSQIQIIVATHSPDIVGPYLDNVIDLGGKDGGV